MKRLDICWRLCCPRSLNPHLAKKKEKNESTYKSLNYTLYNQKPKTASLGNVCCETLKAFMLDEVKNDDKCLKIKHSS
jgi:hypothetical protein